MSKRFASFDKNPAVEATTLAIKDGNNYTRRQATKNNTKLKHIDLNKRETYGGTGTRRLQAATGVDNRPSRDCSRATSTRTPRNDGEKYASKDKH